MREDLIERLRREAAAWDDWNEDHPDDAAVTTPPLLREAAAALEAAQMGLRHAVRVWVLSDEIAWSEEEIDEVVESIISDAKKESGNG